MASQPERFNVTATGGPEGPVPISTESLPTIETGRHPSDGGTGDRWSAEQLLMGAIANAFILSFRQVALEHDLEWRHLSCHVEGATGEDDEDLAVFTEIIIQAEVVVPGESERGEAARCLDQAERECLITNSLEAAVQLHQQIAVSAD
jgi:organic hydroperoxide reductase OsmC/OhrA